MKTLAEEQSKKMQTTSRTSQIPPAGSPLAKRCHGSGDSSRLHDGVETGLTRILNMRVGCWRPPILMDAVVVDRVLKRTR